MGGLIARYGLRKMEMRGERHHVSTLICQDTPNLGANVPLGILYASHAVLKIYNRYLSKFWNINDLLSLLRKYVYCQSAREMLYNFVNEDGNIDNSVHNAFIRELHDMGYPCGDDGTLRCIAISNGNEQIVSANETLLKFNAEVNPTILTDALLSLLSNITGPLLGYLAKDIEIGFLAAIPGTQKLKCSAEINPTGSGKNICDVRLTYKKKILGFVNAQKTFFKYIKSDFSQGISYDIAKGSYYDSEFLLKKLRLPNGTIKDNVWIKINSQMEIKKTFLFVPTASALDIGEGVANLNMSDYCKTYDMMHRSEKPKHSPFHAYYISNQSERHIYMNDNTMSWILSQLKTDVVGDPIGTTGSQYSISNKPESENVTWSSSSPTIASIDATTGVLSCHTHGYTTIIGQLSNGMQYTKRIMSGLPPYTIESQYTNSGYRVSLAINDNSYEYQRYLPFISCERYISQKGWIDFSDMYCWIPFNDNGGDIYVYCRLKYIDINNETKEGVTVSSKINTSKPYILVPNYFEMYSNNEIKKVVLKSNPAFKGVLDDKLKIYYFESHGGIPLSCESGITELTLSANNIFASSQLKAFIENSSQRTIANDFVIRNKKGEPILRFQIPIVKP